MAFTSKLPPGLIHLLNVLPPLLAPPLLTFVFLRHTYPELSWTIPVISFSALPFWILLSRAYHRVKVRRAAAKAGAVLPPHVEDKSLLGVASMKQLKRRFLTGHPAKVYEPWIEKYGPTIMLELFGEQRVFTMDPDYIKAVLATQFENFEKGPIFTSQMKSLLGTGVFNADGEPWKFHRNATKRFFTKDRISDFDNFDRHAEIAIKLAKARLDEGQAFDFQDLVGRFTMDSATEFLFGQDIQSLSAGLAYSPRSGLSTSSTFTDHPSNQFLEAFGRGQDQAALRSRTGPNWRLFEFWHDKLAERRKVIDGYIQKLMKDGPAKKKSDVEKGEEEGCLLEYLAEFMEDPKDLQDEIVNLLVAGRDTTASTLSFGIYKLTEHPDIAKKLVEEVMEQVGPSRRPTFEDIKNMKYLRAFLNEVLRLFPSVPYNNRAANKDVIWRSKDPSKPDYFIPARTRVHYSVMMLHRRKDLWGPTADDFDPSRFIDSRLQQYLIPNPFIFVPFNAGPRICLGQNFAYQEASYFLIKWLQAFGIERKCEVELARDAQPEGTIPPEDEELWGGEKVWPAVSLTMYIKGGLWVRLRQARKPEEK